MATREEIEAAAKAIQAVEDPMEAMSEFIPAACAALDAAERVRAERVYRGMDLKPDHDHDGTHSLIREDRPE
jgi:hypothetical protein